jgi:hypothetical protein
MQIATAKDAEHARQRLLLQATPTHRFYRTGTQCMLHSYIVGLGHMKFRIVLYCLPSSAIALHTTRNIQLAARI